MNAIVSSTRKPPLKIPHPIYIAKTQTMEPKIVGTNLWPGLKTIFPILKPNFVILNIFITFLLISCKVILHFIIFC